ncbi:hypothetical protein [Arenibacter sp. ARW7G5Y1]|uniref:hypothetical protein n=1 Tax=Arenibacter sp. ARW7G5Y1 TaxID=2135619 RepID=UPI000D761781|nr:hypothetical protein [Arenibacter sp. ARW7G5Y1]PXX30626.1 hypothetical protein C7972_102254 [Arenibacter sp. ARW7G5Y1]
MEILRVKFSAYNRKKNQFAQCFLLIQKMNFSISNVFNISKSKDYYICSEIKIDRLIKHKCEEQGGEFWEAYCESEEKGFSFTDFPDHGNLNMNFYRFPRIGEKDFESVVNSLGGIKIQETEKRTPDFEVNNVILELKDLQEESLENKQRQENIAKLFKEKKDYAINIDPSLDFGELTYSYHRIIKNSLKNHFKSASGQIKQHKKNKDFKASGIVLFNTGLYSLPHELFKKMVSDILINDTKTIEFAFIFSQRMQSNGWDMYAVFASEWIGNYPLEIQELKSELDKLVNQKMTEMMRKNDRSNIIESQKPISFEIDNKVFFWNPGQLRFPWETKNI